MMNGLSEVGYTVKPSSRYMIRVRGELESTWSERLGGLGLTVNSSGGYPITTLEGTLRDEAALTGVLATLHDIHMPVLLVMKVDTEK